MDHGKNVQKTDSKSIKMKLLECIRRSFLPETLFYTKSCLFGFPFPTVIFFPFDSMSKVVRLQILFRNKQIKPSYNTLCTTNNEKYIANNKKYIIFLNKQNKIQNTQYLI